METSEIKFRLATQADNDGILRLMHSIVMPGDIELIYMKSPDFFKAVATQGKTQIIIMKLIIMKIIIKIIKKIHN